MYIVLYDYVRSVLALVTDTILSSVPQSINLEDSDLNLANTCNTTIICPKMSPEYTIIPCTVSRLFVSRFGLTVRRYAGKRKDLGSIPLRLSFLFKSCDLWTLSSDFVPHNYEALKWLSSLPTLMQKSVWWWQCSDRCILSLSPHLHNPSPPPPFSPSLMSLMVSVEIEHHVYLKTVACVSCFKTILLQSGRLS